MKRIESAVAIARWVAAGCAFIGLPLIALSQSIQSELLMRLREQDSQALLVPTGSQTNSAGAFIASFIKTAQPVPGFTDSVTISTGEAAWASDWCVVKAISDYEREPAFRPPKSAGSRSADYDTKGDLIAWRNVETYGIWSRERADMANVMVCYTVDAQGKVSTNKTGHIRLNRFQVGDRNSVYLFRQLIQATGRGFAEELSEAKSERVSDEGIEIEATGTCGPGLRGRWSLTCDRGADPLARRASFFTEKNPMQPVVEVSNSGLIKCVGLRMARSGTITLGPVSAHFEVLSLKRLASSCAEECELYREVLKRLQDPLPKGSQVIDQRGETLKIIDVE
jgi:hypothetical protein